MNPKSPSSSWRLRSAGMMGIICINVRVRAALTEEIQTVLGHHRAPQVSQYRLFTPYDLDSVLQEYLRPERSN